jgi:putative endonuclease
MTPPDELGKKGEEIAAGYLIKNGYKILARNWYYDHKEIDIIAQQADEIKPGKAIITRNPGRRFPPERSEIL